MVEYSLEIVKRNGNTFRDGYKTLVNARKSAVQYIKKFGTDSFVCVEEIVPFEHINVGIERLVSASTDAIVNMGNQIKNGEQHSFLIFGAVNRITFGMPEAEEINGSLEAFEKAANGNATKIIVPSEIQGVAGLAKSVGEVLK